MISEPSQNLYADFGHITELKKGAREQDRETIREVARQFESLFVQMMLKSMRDTVPQSELFGSHSERMYRDMYDKQISLNISNGKGIGLARVIERQLGGAPEDSIEPKPIQAYLASPLPVTSSLPPVVELSRISQPGEGAKVMQSKAPEAAEIQQTWDTPEAFIDDIWPHAQRAAKRLGVDPEVLMAQSALETGWGKYLPLRADGSSSFNLFGIKADHRWDGDRVSINTREFRHGVMQREEAQFRAYDSVSEAFDDYADFIMQSPRYQKALEHGYDADAYARELQRAGYATDPDYAKKINRIRNGELLNDQLSTFKNSAEVPLT